MKRSNTPALPTKTSSGPNALTVCSTARRLSAKLVTSPCTGITALPNSAFNSSRRAATRSRTPTRAPSAMKRATMLLPIPEPPPVTRATCLSSKAIAVSRVRWIAPDLDAIPVGIPEVDRLPVPASSPSAAGSVLDLHAALGEMLLEPLEVARIHDHREVVQVLEAWPISQRFAGLHGKEVDHGVRADPHRGERGF